MSQLRRVLDTLRREEAQHQKTRTELQREIDRVWRLVPSHYISLMGVYPSLRKLLHVLAEAADLQDPSSGSPIEDTMRTEYVSSGPNASTSATESGVLSHYRRRQNVRVVDSELAHITKKFNRTIDDKAHDLAKLVGAEEWEYAPPDDECLQCGLPIYQTPTGRRRDYCSSACRQRASRQKEASG